ncbi:MAG: prepilin-type N-terminal cleavage/methylation domain-containing protein [Thermodesulfobacteriota bacterium]
MIPAPTAPAADRGVPAPLSAGRGFTLLEVLVAMAIFAVVAALAYSSYAGIMTAINYTRTETGVYSQVAVALQRIREDLLSAMVLDPADPEGLRGREFFQGESTIDDDPLRTEVHFRTMARLGLDDGKQIRESGMVRYHVARNGTTGLGSLIRRDQGAAGAGNSGAVDGVLCDGLQEARFRFFDDEGEGYRSWPPPNLAEDEKTGVPAAVEVTLLFAAERPDGEPMIFRSAVALPPATYP